ncbi:MAG: hypothetical protein IPJ46_11455 [Anaerolineales bacterium]|nr:hypothetical protein [Anaerolineales bacterium]
MQERLFLQPSFSIGKVLKLGKKWSALPKLYMGLQKEVVENLMEDILSAAEEILGSAVRVESHRDWAVFWCPFHNDASREGSGGHPNFGVNLSSDTGNACAAARPADR